MAVLDGTDMVLTTPRVVNIVSERAFDPETHTYEEQVHVIVFTEVKTKNGTHFNHETYDLDGDTAVGATLGASAVYAHSEILHSYFAGEVTDTDPAELYTTLGTMPDAPV